MLKNSISHTCVIRTLPPTSEKYDLPALACNTDIFPDYIALSRQPSLYHKTELTAVGFWEYDDVFNGHNGLEAAIYYGLEDRLDCFRKRFDGVRFLFTPDISMMGDVHVFENDRRLLMSRVIGVWLTVETSAIVIPFITAAKASDMDKAIDGLEACSVIALSTKGYVDSPIERQELKKIVRIAVDRLQLKAIVVYDVCGTNNAVRDIFAYAYERGVRVVVPMNSLKERNIAHWEARHAQH